MRMKHTLLFVITSAALLGQTASPQKHADPASLRTSGLLSESGPTFRISDNQLAIPLTFITYGDTRFTDPSNTTASDPKVRRWLVNRIAEEHPAAVILNGDVPLAGGVKNNYEVFKAETQPWRDNGLRVFPALGNHEFNGDPRECLENWWQAFPELRNRRWYSAQLGSRVYVITLDSDASLMPDSDQGRWLKQQVSSLPVAVNPVGGMNAYWPMPFRHSARLTLENLSAVREAVEAAGFAVESAELTMIPKTTVEVADENDAKKILRLIDQLEDNDDVQEVFANFDIPERVLEAVAG